MLVSDDFFAGEPRYWPLDQKVSEYHAARGKVSITLFSPIDNHATKLIVVSDL
jgi:hypothetical protein